MLSVLLCIKNEAEHLPACLDSLAFADEIVVIDDESVDASKDIVLSRGAKYFLEKWIMIGPNREISVYSSVRAIGFWLWMPMNVFLRL